MSAGDHDHFEVPGSLEGERVDRAVALVTGYSRADVQDLVGRDAVLVDGEAVAKSRRLREGEVVTLTDHPRPPAPPQAEPLDLDVRHEDAHVAVVAKPAGLVVHPGAGNEHGTLVHGLLHRWPHAAGVGDPMRPGIVHRLDKDTSGLMAVALSGEAYDALVAALSSRSVERRYLALIWGTLDAEQGMIDAPIGRSARRPTRMAVRPGGREARTGYRVLEELDGVSLLELTLETGRTHQIRVHLAAIGHPVVGDGAYGGARSGIDLDRPFLHAYRLAFDHPVDPGEVRVEDALPAELEAVLARLRAGEGEP